MSKHTAVVSGGNLSSLKDSTILSTQSLLKSMIKGRQFFSFDNRVVNCQKIDVLRWLTEMNSVELGGLPFRNILINSVLSTENKQGGSGIICLVTLLHVLNRLNMDKQSGKKTIDLDEVEKELSKISLLTKRQNSKEILKVIRSLNADPTSYAIFKETINRAGGDGSIYIEKSASESTVVHGRHGYHFPGSIPEVFLSASGGKHVFTWNRPKVCVVDGIIERVSEINGIIHESYKNNTPLIIVARGFNDDVQNTLGVNFKSGNLSVFPFCVPYDAFGANLVNDICVVSGCDIISSLKGDLISSVLWEDISSVEKCTIDIKNHDLIIENNCTRKNVDLHKRSIRKKFLLNKGAGWFEGDMSSDVLEKRLSCLMSEGVRLSIGSDLKDSWGVTKDRVETQIKIFKDGTKFGTIDIPNAIKETENLDLKNILNTLSEISPIITSRALFSGIKTGISAAKIMGEVGGIVYFD